MGKKKLAQALHPSIHPSSREISKHHPQYLAAVRYHSLLSEVFPTNPLNEGKVFPESMCDSHRKAQTCS